jgi:succinate dehydrogenase/fumarate reductase flavoprotein subunit
MTYGKICAESALAYLPGVSDLTADPAQLDAERERIFRHTRARSGLPHHQVEYKVRRFVNDYLQPPKTTTRMETGLAHFMRSEEDIAAIAADNPHDLMRAMEVYFIRDCAEMAARASLERTESRWGLYHHRLDYPDMDNERWFVHLNLRKGTRGAMEFVTRPVAPYVVAMSEDELTSYHRLRIPAGRV